MMKRSLFLAAVAVAGSAALPAAAHEVAYAVVMSGASEAPPNASLGTGTASVVFDLDLAIMKISASFSGLTGNTTNAHIHCCTAVPGAGTAGVATQLPSFAGFPSGVTSGSFTNNNYDLSVASGYNPAFVTANVSVSGAMNALLAGAAAGRAYLNIHSTSVPGGEIRGFLQPVPEPETYALMLAGLGLVGLAARRRRRA